MGISLLYFNTTTFEERARESLHREHTEGLGSVESVEVADRLRRLA